MNDDDLDRVLRAGLPAHDMADSRTAEVRDLAREQLRHAARSVRRGWGVFEASASLAIATAQLVWVLSTLLGKH